MIKDRLKNYLLEQTAIKDEAGDPVFDMMVELLCSLSPDELTEDQQDTLGNILSELGFLDEDESDNEDEEDSAEVSEKKIMKISRRAHMAAHKDYKRNRARFKLLNKMYRKTAAFKKWKKKHKRMVKAGRTKTKKYV